MRGCPVPSQQMPLSGLPTTSMFTANSSLQVTKALHRFLQELFSCVFDLSFSLRRRGIQRVPQAKRLVFGLWFDKCWSDIGGVRPRPALVEAAAKQTGLLRCSWYERLLLVLNPSNML